MDFWSLFWGNLKKYLPPFPENVKWTLTDRENLPRTVEWCKKVICDCGFAPLISIAGVTEVRFVKDIMTVPNAQPTWLGTVLGNVVVVADTGWMPGWMLPETICHEAVHIWQTSEGLMKES